MSDALFDESMRVETTVPPIGESMFDQISRTPGLLGDDIRSHLNSLVQAYPAEHRSELVGRLKSRVDPVDFYASYWELLLYRTLTAAGYEVECHPDVPGTRNRPDFRATRAGRRVYVEAKLIGNSAHERRRQRERDEIWAELDRRVTSEHFFVRLGVEHRGSGQIPHKQLASSVRQWLDGLDVHAVRETASSHGPGAIEKFVWRHQSSGWAISLVPLPKTNHRPSHRLVGMGEAEAWFSDDRIAVRKALDDKGHRYGRAMDAPLVVALSLGRSFTDDFDVLNALYGDEVVQIDRATGEVSPNRAPNGVWVGTRGPRGLGISGVLVGKNIGPWSLRSAELKLWTSPWSVSQPLEAPCFESVAAGADALERRPADISLPEFLGLPRDWPGSTRSSALAAG